MIIVLDWVINCVTDSNPHMRTFGIVLFYFARFVLLTFCIPQLLYSPFTIQPATVMNLSYQTLALTTTQNGLKYRAVEIIHLLSPKRANSALKVVIEVANQETRTRAIPTKVVYEIVIIEVVRGECHMAAITDKGKLHTCSNKITQSTALFISMAQYHYLLETGDGRSCFVGCRHHDDRNEL